MFRKSLLFKEHASTFNYTPLCPSADHLGDTVVKQAGSLKASTDGSNGGLNKVVSQNGTRHYYLSSCPQTCRQAFATVCSPAVRVALSSVVPETRYTHITIGSCVSGTPSYPQSTLATIQNTIKGSESSSKRNLLQLEVLPW